VWTAGSADSASSAVCGLRSAVCGLRSAVCGLLPSAAPSETHYCSRMGAKTAAGEGSGLGMHCRQLSGNQQLARPHGAARCEVRGSRFFVGVVLGMTRCDGQDASGGVLDRPMGPCCLSYSMYGLLSSLRLLCICRICRAKGKSALALHAPFPVLPQPANSHSLARAQKPRSPTLLYVLHTPSTPPPPPLPLPSSQPQLCLLVALSVTPNPVQLSVQTISAPSPASPRRSDQPPAPCPVSAGLASCSRLPGFPTLHSPHSASTS
jgi:hypothetical protein